MTSTRDGTVWVPITEKLIVHPRLRKAARLAGVELPHMVGHVVCLWIFLARFERNGNLSGYDAIDIADGAQWSGDPDVLVSALTAAGILTNGYIFDEFFDHLPGPSDRKKMRQQWEVLAPQLRKIVLERDGLECCGCGDQAGPFDVDHILPIARGGTNDLSNLQTLCARCNRSKGSGYKVTY